MADETLTEEQRQAAAATAAQANRDKFAAGADDGTPTGDPAPVVHVKPEHVPEKFFNKDTGEVNYEAWNTAHTALESKFHKGSDTNTDGEPTQTPAGDKPAADGDSTDPVEQFADRPSVKAARDAFAENNELSNEQYAALEADGFDRETVDAYIDGKRAKASVLSDAAFGPAGGEEKYGEMIAWAKDNLDDTSKKAFNTQVSSGDPDVIKNAVTALAAEYGKTANVEGDHVGGSPPANNSSTFASRKEITDAINLKGDDGKRKYDVDPAYRTEVQRKIGNSRKRGTVNF